MSLTDGLKCRVTSVAKNQWPTLVDLLEMTLRVSDFFSDWGRVGDSLRYVTKDQWFPQICDYCQHPITHYQSCPSLQACSSLLLLQMPSMRTSGAWIEITAWWLEIVKPMKSDDHGDEHNTGTGLVMFWQLNKITEHNTLGRRLNLKLAHQKYTLQGYMYR